MKESWAEQYLNCESDKCWFCGKSGCDEFDTEFDTFLHKQCLIDDLNSGNPEAELMKYLLD